MNQVATSGGRAIFTPDVKPTAVVNSVGDYERLTRAENRTADIQKWLADSRVFSDKIERRLGQHLDVDTILVTDRKDLEHTI